VITRKAVIVTIALFVGALHFIIPPDYQGPFHEFIHYYLIDILLPFSMYLIAGLIEHSLLGARWTRAISVFGFGVTVETLQYYDIDVFGSTFDPMDIVMYGIGVVSGIVFERVVLTHFPRKETR
jgi:hypothetical protein